MLSPGDQHWISMRACLGYLSSSAERVVGWARILSPCLASTTPLTDAAGADVDTFRSASKAGAPDRTTSLIP